MRRQLSVCLIALSLVVANVPGASAAFTFTTIDVPGALFTEAFGINGTGQIVGDLFNATGSHGYRLSGGTFTTIDVPGASFTRAFGINDIGEIVGFFQEGSHGYRLSGGTFTTIDVPGASSTSAAGINEIGQIVGTFTASGQDHGFLLSGGTFTTIDVPGASLTWALGINDTGQIVGAFRDATGTHGFVANLLNLSMTTNGGSFRTTDLLTVSVGVENLGLAAVVVDFYFGAVLPDGDTVVFFTDLAFASGVGRLAKPATLQPIAAGVNLTTPFTFSQSTFFTYRWTGGEPPGGYVLFVAAVKSGALEDNSIDPGDIVALATVAVAFSP